MAGDFLTLIIDIVLILAFILIIGFVLFHKRITGKMRKDTIRAWKAAPKKEKGAPLLVHGTAVSPGNVLPSTGEPVAFYALFVMSKGSLLKMDSFGQKLLPSTTSFKIFETSGDFSIIENSTPYTVSITSILAHFYEGASMFATDHVQEAILSGFSENVFNDAVNFEAAMQALTTVLKISAPNNSVRSAVDTRTNTYILGHNVPPAIGDFITKKWIRPKQNEEITVVEFFIPQMKKVYGFGTFDGENSIRYMGETVALSVTYTDPESD